MLLYDAPESGNCYKVRLLLARLGIAYERRESRPSPARHDHRLMTERSASV